MLSTFLCPVEPYQARHWSISMEPVAIITIFSTRTHMQDLKDMTLEVHYENYRAKYITERMSRRQTDRREGMGWVEISSLSLSPPSPSSLFLASNPHFFYFTEHPVLIVKMDLVSRLSWVLIVCCVRRKMKWVLVDFFVGIFTFSHPALF